MKPSELTDLDDVQADQILVSLCSEDMRIKLYNKRQEGRGGWNHSCSNDLLMDMLKEHVEKGDMVDVMNLAGMIHMRKKYGVEGDRPTKVKRTCYTCEKVELCFIYHMFNDTVSRCISPLNIDSPKHPSKMTDIYGTLACACTLFRRKEDE